MDASAARVDQRNAVVVEYFGTHVTGAPHANNKNQQTAASYVRTSAATMDKVRELNESYAPQAAYNKTVSNTDIADAPRDSHVIRNAKKFDKRNQINVMLVQLVLR